MMQSDLTALAAARAVPAQCVSASAARHGNLAIVGIGASAGGLRALESFVSNVPAGSGFAYVIIQHTDPQYEGMLVDLLRHRTHMPVELVQDGMELCPNRIYVAPSAQDVTLAGDTLALGRPATSDEKRLPIDTFFRSLAGQRGRRAVGVLLSGSGVDGSLGLQVIKQVGGLTAMQAPSTTRSGSTPGSALDGCAIDVVEPVEQLPRRPLACLAASWAAAQEQPAAGQQDVLARITCMLHERTGKDFSQYKKTALLRRLDRRMQAHRIETLAQYADFLVLNAQEAELLSREMLIGVTQFFRDPQVWEVLKDRVFPELFARFSRGKRLRAWVPACSTGEEAYTLAISFEEALRQVRPHAAFSLQIFATDVDKDAIGRARQGRYPADIAAQVPEPLLKRYFSADGESGYRISQRIREMIVFAPHNAAMDPPFSRLDLVSSRNLLIYLDAPLQDKLLRLFHYALQPSGYLLMGSTESAGSCPQLFAPVAENARLYQRQQAGLPMPALDFSFAPAATAPGAASEPEHPSATQDSLRFHADRFLLEHFAPEAVLVNEDGDILYFNGAIERYFEPAAGKTNWNIYALAREGLRSPLHGALGKALLEPGSITLANLCITDGNGRPRLVNVTVQRLQQPQLPAGLIMIVFRQPAALSPTTANDALFQKGSELAELERSLRDMQAQSETLRAANEELTTSREELQSLNEELHAVNMELRSKYQELAQTGEQMKSMLEDLGIGLVTMDTALRVQRFSPKATQLFRLVPADIGRPLSDIFTNLAYPDIYDDLRMALHTRTVSEKTAATRDQRWFRVKIMPYPTVENAVDGVVLTFAQYTAMPILEQPLLSSPSPGRTDVTGASHEN